MEPKLRPGEYDGGPATWLASQLSREFHRPDNLSSLALEGVTLELLAEVARRRALDEEPALLRWLRQTRAFLDDCLTDSMSKEDP